MGAIAGVVVDSVNGGPLVGAQLSVEGLTAVAITDSTGHFRIDSVPAGTYRIGVFHPFLDSLALSIASPPLTVPPGGTLNLVFATPSAPTVMRLACANALPDTTQPLGPSLLLGRVLDAETDAPVANARVRISWTEIQSSHRSGVHRITRGRDTTTGPNGTFQFCFLPASFGGTVRAMSAAGDSAVVSRPYAMNGHLIGRLVLHLPSADTALARRAHHPASDARTSSRLGIAVLSGRVIRPESDGGGPQAGAQVTVLGAAVSAVTDDSGRFTLRDLPAGTRTVQIRAVGWQQVSMPVELTKREPRQVVVSLETKTAVLQTVVVTGKINAGLQRVGFDARRRMGNGHFLTPEEIARRNALQLVDLMRGMPGVVRRVGENGGDYLEDTRGAGGCVTYVVDGMTYQESTPGDINTIIQPSDIGAIELYQPAEAPAANAFTPPALTPRDLERNTTFAAPGTLVTGNGIAGGTTCVKILIWTKEGLGS